MLHFIRPLESSSMASLDPVLREFDHMAFLKEAAETKKDMIALFIPYLPEEALEGSAGHQPSGQAHSPAASMAEQFLRLRRRRDKIFGARLFADPAWDMLLDLFLVKEKGLRPISTSSLCIASAVPSTTALRWIETLVQEGLFSRHADPVDKRRTFVHLTDAAWQKMHELLTFWAEKR